MILELLVLILAYILGSIPFGVVLGKIVKSIDVRELGSGSMGMTNVIRTVGIYTGIAVLILDMLKSTDSSEKSTDLYYRSKKCFVDFSPIYHVFASPQKKQGKTRCKNTRWRIGGKKIVFALHYKPFCKLYQSPPPHTHMVLRIW